MAASTIDRTAYNALVDDAGDGLSGTVWAKSNVKDILDAIDNLVGKNPLELAALTVDGALTASGLLTAAIGINSTGRLALTSPAALTLANGRNDNVAIGNCSYRVITGPTAAFQISGIVPQTSADGQVLFILHNVSQTLTFNHADTNSLAANRIYCPGSVNKAAANTTFVMSGLIYASIIPGWVLMFTN